MEKRHPHSKKTKEMMKLPTTPVRDELPEILRDALEMKHFTLPKLPKKYRIPELLKESNTQNAPPKIIFPPSYRSNLPTKLSKKMMPFPEHNPQVGNYLPSQEKYLSWVDIVAMPRYQTPDTEPMNTQHRSNTNSSLSLNKYAGNPSKNSCSCEKCHFAFEEKEAFPYLPKNVVARLQQEHQVLKERNYPAQEVKEHAQKEINYFRQYLPTHLLEKIESDHHQIEQGSQNASSCKSCSVASKNSPSQLRAFQKGAVLQNRLRSSQIRNTLLERGHYLPKPDGFRPHPGPQPEPGDPGPGPGGTPGPGTPYDTTVSYCKSYDGIAECTENASASNPIIRSAVDPSLLELALCVGQSHLFRLFITLTNGNLQTTMVCTDPYALLYQIDEVQSITIQYILWECEGAIPAKKYGKTYEALFPKVGYYVIRAYVYLTRPEFCFSGKQELVAKPFIVVVNGVQSIRSNNGFVDGQNLGFGEKEIVELEALFLVSGIVDKEEMRWELSPPESGELLYSTGKILNRFFPAEDYRGEIIIKAKLCSTDPGAEFHLKVIGDLWIEADKEILCKDSDEVVNLQAYTNSENVGGGDILWGVDPEEAGSLASGTGFTNQFIPNPDYVSESYQDIKITAQLYDQNDSAKITVVSFELYSKGIRKDELSNENTGINAEENSPWDSGMNGRLFVDTDEEWKGKCLDPNMFDKQRVLFRTEIIPHDIPPEKLKLQWILNDPDDDSSHPYIDHIPYYGPDRVPFHGDLDPINYPKPGEMGDTFGIGGDNTGLWHEKTDFWFTEEDVIEDSRVLLDKKYRGTTNWLETVKTNLVEREQKLTSRVFFNFSDHGGDNFKIQVILLEKDQTLCKKETGKLSVWRKRCVEIMGVEEHYPWYPLVSMDKAAEGISKILNEGFNGEPNLTYIDFYVKAAEGFTKQRELSRALPPYPGHKPWQKIHFNTAQEVELSLIEYAIKYITTPQQELFSSTIKIIGFMNFGIPSSEAGEDNDYHNPYLGFAPQFSPYIFLNTEVLFSKKPEMFKPTVIHEMSHCLSNDIGYSGEFTLNASDVHKYHENMSYEDSEQPYAPCALAQGSSTEIICKRHIRLLRNSIKRLFLNQGNIGDLPRNSSEVRKKMYD